MIKFFVDIGKGYNNKIKILLILLKKKKKINFNKLIKNWPKFLFINDFFNNKVFIILNFNDL